MEPSGYATVAGIARSSFTPLSPTQGLAPVPQFGAETAPNQTNIISAGDPVGDRWPILKRKDLRPRPIHYPVRQTSSNPRTTKELDELKAKREGSSRGKEFISLRVTIRAPSRGERHYIRMPLIALDKMPRP